MLDLTASATETIAQALFLIIAMSVAGVINAIWLRHPASQRFAVPLDGGALFRNKRIFGENKTLRGIIVIVPAAAFSFWAMSLIRPMYPTWMDDGIWPLSPIGYGLLGMLAGAAFMMGELPNSFCKRQLDISPGGKARSPIARVVQFVVDRTDSIVALLIAISFVVPVSLWTWAYAIIFGSIVHLGFSVLLYSLEIKARPG